MTVDNVAPNGGEGINHDEIQARRYAEPDWENWTTTPTDLDWPVQMFMQHNPNVVFDGDTLLNYDAGCYRAINTENTLREFLERFDVVIERRNDYPLRVHYRATPARIKQFAAKLAEEIKLSPYDPVPHWRYPPYDRDDDAPAPANQCLCFENAIVNALTGETTRPTPHLLSTTGFDFNYDPHATCELWQKTVNDYWPLKSDGTLADEALLLQEMFGYLLLPKTDLHKIFMLIGSGRNGKGTITRLLTYLLGRPHVAFISMHDLSARYSRAGFIGKRLAIVGEGTFGTKDDTVTATTFLKTVSGEDEITIRRNGGRAPWTGILRTRFLITANTIPEFVDDSPALSLRTVSIPFTRTFSDDERDTALDGKLQAEAAGIINWTITGYQRVMKAQKFTLPAASVQLTARIAQTASRGILSFIEDFCDLTDIGATVTERELYAAYRQWCADNGIRVISKSKFLNALLAAKPALAQYRPRDGGVRERSLRGVRLIP